MYSYRSTHTADMRVNTAFSCRICHIMSSEICHRFFMLLQDPIFISTCMLTLGWQRKCIHRNIRYYFPKKSPKRATFCLYRQCFKNLRCNYQKKGGGRRRRAFQYDSRLVATLIDDCHTESNRWIKF